MFVIIWDATKNFTVEHLLNPKEIWLECKM